MNPVRAVDWSPDLRAVRIIDQRRLPRDFVERDLRTTPEFCEAIGSLAVRGAPAIGICAAMGLVVVTVEDTHRPLSDFREVVAGVSARLVATRPTAVNLSWAVTRVQGAANAHHADARTAWTAMRAEADAILQEDRAMCEAIGAHGQHLIGDGMSVLTHCNAGSLATGGIGTALAPIYSAVEQGRRVHVFADETRPLLQGGRLTAWELTRASIPVTVIVDGAAAGLMRAGRVGLCIVGADRIAANGDVANKIGTYALAVAAKHHGVPFYVAAPSSTIDADTPCGDDIVIEQRAREEVEGPAGAEVVARDAAVYNPAFDVTPAALVTGIITESGLHTPPFNFAS